MVPSWLNKWVKKQALARGRKVGRTRSPRTSQVRLGVEGLEGRELLSGDVPLAPISPVAPSVTNTALRVTGFPTTDISGVAHSFTVTAVNANGIQAFNYGGTIAFSSSDPNAILPAKYTFTTADHGSHTFVATLTNLDSQSLTATDTANAGTTGTESGINVASSPPTTTVATASPSPWARSGGRRSTSATPPVPPSPPPAPAPPSRLVLPRPSRSRPSRPRMSAARPTMSSSLPLIPMATRRPATAAPSPSAAATPAPPCRQNTPSRRATAVSTPSSPPSPAWGANP
jgi:hypothetical protein